MCGAYARLTNRCWAKLVRLSERPEKQELLDLQEKSLHALIKAVGCTYGGDWRKPELAAVLLAWMKEHPGQALPLPLGRLRDRRRRQSGAATDQLAQETAPDGTLHRERDAAWWNASCSAGGGPAATSNAGGAARQATEEVLMTDAEGSHRQAHAGSSGPIDDGNCREKARRPTGRAERADGVRQSADALRESSRSILATLDAVAQLFERARRGEECPEEEGKRIAAMVEDSRKTLTGVVAGFAAADLLAALTPAPETEQRPSATNRAGGASGRTYAQAARTGPPPPENRPGPPHRQAPPAPWAPERTALLHPAEDRQRQAPTRASEFGAELDRVLRSDLELAQGPAVELVRRTAKGEYAVQFGAPAWARLQDDRTITLPSFGRWFRRVADPARRQRNSVVLQGVPKSMTPDQVVRDLLSGNGERWKDLNGPDLDDVRVERLNRRVPAPATAGDGQDSRPRSQWLPSASVRVFASAAFCTAILEEGGVVVGYSFCHARPYERAPIRCYRCGEMGFHVGKYCKNKPHCRHCGKGHETSTCPDRGPDLPHKTNAGGPRRGAAPAL